MVYPEKDVFEEYADISVKVNRMSSYLNSPVSKGLPIEEQELLVEQHKILKEYRAVLSKRIKLLFNE